MNRFQAVVSFIFILFGNQAFAGNITVCPSCEVKSLTKAIGLASNGDVITVQKGVYKEGTININKRLVIRGEGLPVFDGEMKYETFIVTHDSVTIEGLKIINVGHSYTQDNSAIRVIKSDYFILRNNLLENTFFGIFIERGKHGLIENNKVFGEAVEQFNSGNAIHLWQTENILIKGNHVKQHRDGIYLEFVDSSLIVDNISEQNLRYGLHFMFSNDDEYRNNIFKNNGAGVAVMFSKFIYMYDNRFVDNWGAASYGLLLKEIYDGEISGNVFYRNTIAVNAEGSNRLRFHNNDFERNGWALRVLGACFDNSFKHNNFLYNTFDVSYTGRLNGNLFEENFWSQYAGYDLDRDGIGDVPFRPVKLFSYVVNQVPESIVLIRSLFVGVINFSEKVTPVFTPDNLMDSRPRMFRME